MVGAAATLAIGSAVIAQTLQAPTMGKFSATEVGIEPVMKVPPAHYLAEANAFDDWIVAAGLIGLERSRSPALRAFAEQAIAEHRSLRRSRSNADARQPPDLAKALASLRGASAPSFDALFWRDQLVVHRRSWALHSGFAVDGLDRALRRRAQAAVALEERHLHALPMRPMPY